MIVNVLSECGYFASMLGLSLSYNQDPGKMPAVADKLKAKDNGHNKFLESICIWIDVDGPRYWHQELDTYRIGVTKQSESTIHTILRAPLTNDNFEGGDIPDSWLIYLNSLIEAKDFLKLKKLLPESFLQRRIITTNYKTLRHIFKQRYNHKLKEWRYFCDEIYKQSEHKEFLEDLVDVI